MAEPTRVDGDQEKQEQSPQPTRRALIASVAALVAGALTKATDRPAEADSSLTPWFLNQRNFSFDETQLSFFPPPQLEGLPAVRIEALGPSKGLVVHSGPFAGAFAVTFTAGVPGRPAVVAVGEPALIGAAMPGAFPTTQSAFILERVLNLAEGSPAAGVLLCPSDAGTGLLAVQGSFSQFPSLLPEALGVTGTAIVPAGLTGFSDLSVGVHARVFGVTGTAAFLEAPEGGTAAMLKGHLFAESATFDGDVDVNGTLRVNGVPVGGGGGGGGVQASGIATIPAGADFLDVFHQNVTDTSFVTLSFQEPPQPKQVEVSHITTFAGGFRVFLTRRSRSDLTFKWVALPC